MNLIRLKVAMIFKGCIVIGVGKKDQHNPKGKVRLMSKRFMWTSQGTLAVGIRAKNSGLKYVVAQLEKESCKYSVNKVSTGECYLWDSLTDTVSPIDTFGLIIDGFHHRGDRALSESEKIEVASVSQCAKKWIDQKLSV